MNFFDSCTHKGHLPRSLTAAQRRILKTLGFEFQENCTKQPKWQHVALPEGWTEVNYINAAINGSDLLIDHLDTAQVVRVYTEYSSPQVTTLLTAFWIDHYPPGFVSVRNRQNRTVYFEAPRQSLDSREYDPAAIAWLDEHYPDWRNPLAYWDDNPPAKPA